MAADIVVAAPQHLGATCRCKIHPVYLLGESGIDVVVVVGQHGLEVLAEIFVGVVRH